MKMRISDVQIIPTINYSAAKEIEDAVIAKHEEVTNKIEKIRQVI